ncbi:MAG TPA: RNA polymerase sigma-70 factor [Gemmatimonadaceae bacterium]|nr:RNA polymerase sigma-70 factor [Gemmatimonadaceae bacterium]
MDPDESPPSDDSDRNDASLVDRMRVGDATALGTLMDRHAAALHRFARRIVRRTDLADDVVQDVFVSLWERREGLVIAESVRAYLYRATRNQALKTVRHEQAEARAQFHAGHSGDAESGATGQYAHNEGESDVAAEELETIVRRTLETLQPQLREVFLLRQLHGLSYEEISGTLGLKVVTVRSQMSRALRILTEAVEQGWR